MAYHQGWNNQVWKLNLLGVGGAPRSLKAELPSKFKCHDSDYQGMALLILILLSDPESIGWLMGPEEAAFLENVRPNGSE